MVLASRGQPRRVQFRARQLDFLERRERVAEDGALRAAGGADALLQLRLERRNGLAAHDDDGGFLVEDDVLDRVVLC